MIYKEYKNNSFNLYTIKTDRFKTCYMDILFYNKLDNSLITKENVLTGVLQHSSKKYPKRKFVVEHLEDLYNASFYTNALRFGNMRVLSFCFSFLDPIYTDKNYLKEVIKFPFEMIFNPNIKNNEFDERTLKIIKNRVHANIESVKEAPTRYAIKRAINTLNKDLPAATDMEGNIKDLNKINKNNLVDFYKYVLDNYSCDIYLIGNLNMDKMNIMIKDLFINDIIKTNKINAIVPNNTKSKKEVIEKEKYDQSTLVAIYNINSFTDFEKKYVLSVFNSIFGSGSLNNKLFTNLREKNSLCYSVASHYQRSDNILIVYTGIDAKNKNKAVKLIDKSLKEMQNGDFTDEEIDNAIKTLISGFNEAKNYPSFLVDNYFSYNNLDFVLIDDLIDKISEVTRKDIINLAKKIKLNLIYMMEGDNK